jgi:hypothetical protein
MNKRILIAMIVLLLVSLACGISKKNSEEQSGPPKIPFAAEPAQNETDSEDTASPEPESQVETKIVDEAPTEAVVGKIPPGNPDAPRFFRDEFDGPLDEENWYTEYSFFVDENVEQGDDEAVPNYSIVQERGVLKFDLESPWLYIYHFYTPHKYQDVRIDLEIENKGVNTNNISLFCRNTDYGWYEFIATSGGYYSIMRYYEDGDEELAAGGIRSIKFGDKKKNIFTAICKGKTLTYLVNDIEIANVKDEEIPDEGYVGLNVSAEEVTPVKIEINWLEISEP